MHRLHIAHCVTLLTHALKGGQMGDTDLFEQLVDGCAADQAINR
jgi:hypothetical protein